MPAQSKNKATESFRKSYLKSYYVLFIFCNAKNYGGFSSIILLKSKK